MSERTQLSCFNCNNDKLEVISKKMPYVQHPVEVTRCPECTQTVMTTQQMKIYRELAKFDGNDSEESD